MPEPPDLHEAAREFIAGLARDPETAARIRADAARRQRPTLSEQIVRHFREDPEARKLVERVKAEGDARKASRRLPTPPRKQLPSAGKRGKR